ncbi:MAG: hypothetical protein MI919_30795, partial [Holophagales bacterium]|nr:hypothetical protein [Holophagales bacterium]
MKKLFLIVVLLAAAPALMAQPEGTKAVRGEEWAEVGPGLDERVRPGAEVEYRARGAAGLQLLLDGLRSQLEGLPADSRRRQAIERMEEQLKARADGAAKSSQAVCAPITRRISAQYASFYPGSGCTGREHEVDVFGTWDGQGCVVDIYVPGNLAQCGIQTLPSTVESYRTPAGDCIECAHGSPL